MDRSWVDRVVAALGPRYRLGAETSAGAELQYRAGRSEYRPSRFTLGVGPSGQGLQLDVDMRVPKGATREQSDQLIGVLEAKTMTPRGFVRAEESSMAMTSDLGADAGSVRSIRYRHDPLDPPVAAKHVRAIVESIDIPIILGIHEAEHLVAKDPPPDAPKPKAGPAEPLDLWEYQLDGGLLRALTVVVDPNDRTLRVVERRLLSSKDLGEKLKLAHVAKLGLRRREGAADVVAIKRDGTVLALATGSGSDEFVATLGRLAKKVMIPLEELR